ncbi:MAG TPA: SDR family oxidoreductase [Phycisphaerae bacterium]|nr:SDR family oxidoreductase [Phycisphaerae bacterium]HRR85762.1 SDR family oxidoreductase [Phycisphaerae bacterium]
MITLKRHAALVTGSTKGVGRAIAIAFAEAGADVVIHGRTMSDEARETMEQCRRHAVRVAFVAGDLSGPGEAAVNKVFADATAAHDGIDILVNNAGQYFDVPFLEMDIERFERTMRLNVASGYFLTQRFARRWIERKTAGRVLFIGSINGRLAEPLSTAYDTSKGAVEMMVRTLAVELAPRGIRVNGLAPGLVRSASTAWLDSRPAKAAWIASHTPDRQIPDASVCGPGAVYLVSDAAQHVHGHMLLIDGGMSALQQPEPPAT